MRTFTLRRIIFAALASTMLSMGSALPVHAEGYDAQGNYHSPQEDYDRGFNDAYAGRYDNHPFNAQYDKGSSNALRRMEQEDDQHIRNVHALFRIQDNLYRQGDNGNAGKPTSPGFKGGTDNSGKGYSDGK